MSEISESFRPVKVDFDDTGTYSRPELLYATSGARLYRVRKAGKFFMLKTPATDMGLHIDLLKREYELSVGFTHPHIINVYTYEPQTPVGPAIVMEYVDGRHLADFLLEHPSRAARIRIFGQLLSAIACLHKADVIHNDLKPQNILVTRANDDVKLIDFGLSDNSAHFLMKHLGGTPRYAAPELLAGQSTDARSDIYSIGQIMRDLFGNRYGKISRKCLQTDPAKRYSNVEALQRAWQRRRLPQQLASALFLASAIVLPSALYVAEHLDHTALQQTAAQQSHYYDSLTTSLRQQMAATHAAIARREHLVDSLTQLYDQQVAHAYQQAKDSISAIPYKEFAFTPVNNFCLYSWKLDERYTLPLHDLSVRSQLSAHFQSLRNRLQQQLYGMVNLKPMLDAQKMDKEEYQYYIDLLYQKKKYQKYRPE